MVSSTNRSGCFLSRCYFGGLLLGGGLFGNRRFSRSFRGRFLGGGVTSELLATAE